MQHVHRRLIHGFEAAKRESTHIRTIVIPLCTTLFIEIRRRRCRRSRRAAVLLSLVLLLLLMWCRRSSGRSDLVSQSKVAHLICQTSCSSSSTVDDRQQGPHEVELCCVEQAMRTESFEVRVDPSDKVGDVGVGCHRGDECE